MGGGEDGGGDGLDGVDGVGGKHGGRREEGVWMPESGLARVLISSRARIQACSTLPFGIPSSPLGNHRRGPPAASPGARDVCFAPNQSPSCPVPGARSPRAGAIVLRPARTTASSRTIRAHRPSPPDFRFLPRYNNTGHLNSFRKGILVPFALESLKRDNQGDYSDPHPPYGSLC